MTCFRSDPSWQFFFLFFQQTERKKKKFIRSLRSAPLPFRIVIARARARARCSPCRPFRNKVVVSRVRLNCVRNIIVKLQNRRRINMRERARARVCVYLNNNNGIQVYRYTGSGIYLYKRFAVYYDYRVILYICTGNFWLADADPRL